MNKTIKLAVVEDDDFYRANIIRHIKPHNDIKIMVEASNSRQLIHAIKEEDQKPDVVLLDYEMPIMNGTETTQYLYANYPDIRILILTAYNDNEIASNLIECGAHGFLLKENGLGKMVDAVRTIHKHKYFFSEWDLKKVVAAKKSITLSENKNIFSERELDVIQLILEGCTNKEISTKLFLSTRTIETHRERLFQKTNSRNIAQLAVYVVKHNLIEINYEKK